MTSTMMKSLRYILLTVASTALLSMTAGIGIKASLETPVVEMGSLVNLKVQFIEPVDSQSQMIRMKDEWPQEVEINGNDSIITTKSIGNGLKEITIDYKLQSFDSGAYVLPPFIQILGVDTLTSDPITLKINPVDVSGMEDIHPMASVMKIEGKWYDFLPDWVTDYWWIILIAIALIALIVIAVLIFTKRLKMPFIARKPEEPPYEQAKRLLGILREEHLWEKGRAKDYYSQLTEILRRYIGRRYEINALEATSTQLLQELNKMPDIKNQIPLVKAVLDTADFVKFAKMQPLPDVNAKSFDAVNEFVDTTRPIPAPTDEDTKEKSTKKKKSKN